MLAYWGVVNDNDRGQGRTGSVNRAVAQRSMIIITVVKEQQVIQDIG